MLRNDIDLRLVGGGFAKISDLLFANVNEGGLRMLFDNLNEITAHHIPENESRARLFTILNDMTNAIDRETASLSGNVRSRIGGEILVDARDF